MTVPYRLSDRLLDWRVFSPGYLVELVDAPGDERHRFCGSNDTVGATCVVGDHPLLRFLEIDTSDARLGLGGLGIPRLPLLYCWRCDLGDMAYSVDRDGSVEVHGAEELARSLEERGESLEAFRARMAEPDDFPYADYPASFESKPIALSRLPEVVCRHQIGGFPYLVQGSWVSDCGACGAKTVFIATVADNNGTTRGFVDNAWVQVLFFFCPACRRMEVTNICD